MQILKKQSSRITIYLSAEDIKNLRHLGKQKKMPKSRILKEALYLLMEKELDDDLRQGAIANAEEDLTIAEEGMKEWSEMVQNYPYDEN